MRKFLVKLVYFSILPVLYFGTNGAINGFLIKNQSLDLESGRVLIMGDSHPQKSLNPAFFESATNISQSAEPYVLTYWKLQKVLGAVQPDTLILGFSPHNISAFNDFKFSNKRWSEEMFKRSYTIENFSHLESKMPIDYMTYYKAIWKQVGFYPKKNHVKYIGEFVGGTSSDVSDWENNIDRHYYMDDHRLGVSKVATSYLDSIVMLCRSNGVVPVLVGSPLYGPYLSNIPDEILEEYDAISQKYSRSGTVIKPNHEDYADSLFQDAEHLNELGAEKFTYEVIQKLSASGYSGQPTD